MSEKRFKVTNISENENTGLFWSGKDNLSVYDVVRILNELSEENKELKDEIKEGEDEYIEEDIGYYMTRSGNKSLTDGAEKYSELYYNIIKENEELKHFIKHYEQWFRNEGIKEIIVGDCKVVLK